MQLLCIFPLVSGNLPPSSITSQGQGCRAAGKARTIPGYLPVGSSFLLPAGWEEPLPLPEMEKAGQTADIWPWGSVEWEESDFFFTHMEKVKYPEEQVAPPRAALPQGKLASNSPSRAPPI